MGRGTGIEKKRAREETHWRNVFEAKTNVWCKRTKRDRFIDISIASGTS